MKMRFLLNGIYLLFAVLGLSSSVIYAQADWIQIGSDIDGEAAGDRSGYAVSLNADGTVVAVGATQNDGGGTNSGHVRVYENVADVWTQLGGDIDGEAAGDIFGNSVSINDDGTIVAIGGPNNDGGGSNSGHARVYELIGAVWTQIGSDINGEAAGDLFGTSISINGDGTIVAIGGTLNNGSGPQSGHVRVYENIGGIWTQIGADIDGEAALDWSGSSVSLSSDGTIVAIGAFKNDDGGSSSGHVRVFENVGGIWTQIGADVDGQVAFDEFGRSVSISSDGSTFIAGAPKNDGVATDAGNARVFENIGGTWTQIGASIEGIGMNDECGWSVSISGGATTIAVGSPRDFEFAAEAGKIRAYENIAGSWVLKGTDIFGEAIYDRWGWAVSLDDIGNTLAGGAYVNDGNGVSAGHTRVYRFDCEDLITEVSETELCFGELLTLTGTSTIGSTVTWDMGVINGVPFTPGATGVITYTATTDSPHDCPFSVDITVLELPVVTAAVDPTEICLGESATFTGGGTVSYAWDLGVTDGTPFTPATDGTVTYTVTGTDANGCENTATVDLTVNPLPVVTAAADPVEICLGESITFTGGGADSYDWDGGVTDGLAFTPVAVGPATYTVTGTDANGCENTATVDIIVNEIPVVSGTATPDEVCLGESIVFEGAGADTYLWDGGVVDGVAFTPIAAGMFTYNVTGTVTATGCESVASVSVTVFDLPTVTATVDPTEICLGESATFTGGGAVSYAWDLGVIDGTAFTPATDGTVTYTVTGTDGNGCENTATVDLPVNPLPVVTATADPTEICLGESITFTGGGAVSYDWDGGVTDGLAFTPVDAGPATYTVTGTDANGCENTAMVDVIVNDTPSVAGTVTPHEICLGESVVFEGSGADTYVWDGGILDGVPFTPIAAGTFTYNVLGTMTATGCQSSGSATITVFDIPTVTAAVDPAEICLGETAIFTGGGALTYAWDGGVVDGMAFTPVATGTVTYTVTGTSADGCENTATVDLIVNPLPIVAGVATPTEICLDESIVFTGSGADSYVWDGGIIDGIDFTPVAAGTFTYTVTGTDIATGCENTATVDVTVYENPVVTATATPMEICLGESVVLTGGGADSYAWDMGVMDGVAFTPTETGLFSFTVTGYLGPLSCETSASVTIVVNEVPEVIATVEPDTICLGESVVFKGEGANSYEWDMDVMDDESFTPEEPGIFNFTVIGTSDNGCQNTATVQLVVFALPDLAAELDTVINTGGTANLLAYSSLPGSYYWYPYKEVECDTCRVTTASPIDNTTFIVEFVDENGCMAEAEVEVYVNYIEGIGVPSAFSPNNDGNNDILFVKGYNLREVYLEIYNKYGEKVFETSDQNIGWDGTFKNRDENPGVFTWVLRYNLNNGNIGDMKGNTTLIR